LPEVLLNNLSFPGGKALKCAAHWSLQRGKGGREIKTSDLVEIASDPAFAVDESLRVAAWNESARKLLGYTAEEAMGK